MADYVSPIEAVMRTLQRCHDAGGFVYYGSDMGVLAAAIVNDLEQHSWGVQPTNSAS